MVVELFHAHELTDVHHEIQSLSSQFLRKGLKVGFKPLTKTLHVTRNGLWTTFFCPSPPFRRHLKIPLRSPGQRLSVVTILSSRTALVTFSSRLQYVLQNIRNFPFTIKLAVEINQAIGDEEQSCKIKCTFRLSLVAEKALSRSFNPYPANVENRVSS